MSPLHAIYQKFQKPKLFYINPSNEYVKEKEEDGLWLNGDRGVVLVDPDGESGPDVVSRDTLLQKLELGRIMVMLRVMGTSTGRVEDERVWVADNESYFRSLPRPDSGVGPARVSSQSL